MFAPNVRLSWHDLSLNWNYFRIARYPLRITNSVASRESAEDLRGPFGDDVPPRIISLERNGRVLRDFPVADEALRNILQYITPYGVIYCMEQLTAVLTAISHPTRRAIIAQLANGPARFLDVAKPFDTALNAVTKHLKLLERAGLIERKKQGREVLISFRGEPLRQVAGWVHEYERFWNERLDQFEQYFKNKKKKEKK
jgi:DNA-binding transcriptional ArsR family regulator